MLFLPAKPVADEGSYLIVKNISKMSSTVSQLDFLAFFILRIYGENMRSLLTILILTFAIAGSGGSAVTDSTAVSLDLALGFNGHFQLNKWTPLNVILENRGPVTSGNLEVIVTSGSEYRGDVYRTVYAAHVELPQGSKKRYAFTILIKSFTHDLIIRLRQDDTIIFTRSMALRSRFTENRFVVVADDFVTPDILSVMPDGLYPANVRPQTLPETWYGYDSVKMLVLHTDTIAQLRDGQFQALIQWLLQGGHLVLGSGLNYGSLNEPRVQKILPLTVSGHRRLMEIKSLRQFCSRELTSEEPFLVLSTRIDNSSILVKENDIPIIVLKKIGFGQALFLAFDYNTPPFNSWNGRRMFWEKILSLRSDPNRPLIELKDQQIVQAMLAGMPLSFPNFTSVSGFVGAYLILLWLLLKKIKLPGKSRWRYGLFSLVLVVIFGFIAFRGFNYPKPNKKFAYNSFSRLDLAGIDAPAVAKYFIGLYSLENLSYGLRFGSYRYPVTHIIPEKSDAKIPAPYELQQKDGGQQIVGAIKRWSHVLFKLNLQLAAPLAGHARRDSAFMSLKIENRLPHDLVDCLIYYNKRFLAVEDIQAGNRQTISIDLMKLKKVEIFGEHQIERLISGFKKNGADNFLRHAQQHLAPDLLLAIHGEYKSRPDRVVLLGWLNSGLIQPQFSQSGPPPGSGISAINWEMPVELSL